MLPPQNLPFLETSSPTSDSCDESLTTQNTVKDTSSILNRPPLPPSPTTRTLHIPDPSSVLQYNNSCPHNIPTATTKLRQTPIPTLPKNSATPSTSQTPMKTTPEHTAISSSELSSFTFPHSYPRLERLQSTTVSSLTELYYKDSTASIRVPRHFYNLRSQSRRHSPEIQSLTSSSTNSILVRQQAQPRSETLSLSSSHPLHYLLYHYHFKPHQDLNLHIFFQKFLKLYQIVPQTFHEFIHLVQYYLIHPNNCPSIF